MGYEVKTIEQLKAMTDQELAKELKRTILILDIGKTLWESSMLIIRESPRRLEGKA